METRERQAVSDSVRPAGCFGAVCVRTMYKRLLQGELEVKAHNCGEETAWPEQEQTLTPQMIIKLGE